MSSKSSNTIIRSRNQPSALRPMTASHALRIAQGFGLDNKALSERLHISTKTLERRLESGTLEPGEAIFAEMLERIQGETNDYFPNPDDARAWLTSPLLGLGNKSPIDLLTSIQGYDRVREALLAQAYGMFG